MKVHNLKILPNFFKDVKDGIKKFEIRKNDRDYQVEDTLILQEYNPNGQGYTGAWSAQKIVYKLDDTQFVKEGFVVLGIEEIIPEVSKHKKN